MANRTVTGRVKRIIGHGATVLLFLFACAIELHRSPGLANLSRPQLGARTVILAQYIQRIATEEKKPARREARTFRQTTRAHDAAFKQAARTDAQTSRKTVWDFDLRFRSEQRRTVREKVNEVRDQEQVIRTDRASFNMVQARERQSQHVATAQQRREQTLQLSREIRQTNVERQKANRQRTEEVRDAIRSEIEQIQEQNRTSAR